MVPVPFRDAPPLTRAVVLRAIGFGVAVVLGAIAIWMITTGTDQKGIKIGFIAGLWGVLLGAYSMFGSRRLGEDGHDADRSRTEVPVLSSTDVELRSGGEVERIAEAAARRAFEERLQAMIRTELATAMTREVSDLRAEIARLRGDLLEKVGGQLRLERIETTRLIGSDLEALQHEVRQLKAASESGTLIAELGLGERSVHRIVEPGGASETVRTVTEVTPRPNLHQPERADAPERPAPPERSEKQEKAEKAEKADKSARKRAAAQKAEAVRLQAAERAAADRAAADRAEAERADAERAAADRAAAERAAVDNAAAERAATENAARERAAAERAEHQRAAAERAAAAKAAAERAQREKAEREKAEREKAEREKAERDTAERDTAERDTAERETAEREKAEREKAAADKARAALNPPGGPQRTPWTPPTAPPGRSRPTPAETTGPVMPVPSDARRETVRGTWTPPAPRPAPQPAAAPQPDRPTEKPDPFADLPRITPFTDFALDPIDTRPPAPNGYTGRRRASADDAEASDAAVGTARHSQGGAEGDTPERPGRRHRRAEENSEAGELLARLLARESAQR